MTSPNPFDTQDAYTTLRRRWLTRYLKVERERDIEVKSLLIEAANSTQNKIILLNKKPSFSTKTRIEQLRLSLAEIRAELRDVFNDLTPIIRDGSQDAAVVAVDAQGATDRPYLRRAFGETGLVDNYLKIERNSARLGVQAAIANHTKSNLPLSRRVYRSFGLANNWVKRQVTIGILRGDSADDIAKTVRSSINPDVPGGVSYAARRLARTEINNAFHATSIALSEDRPWIEGMAWNLSSVHKWHGTRNAPVEICEQYAAKKWTVETVPSKPHPQCRCFVTPIVEPFDVFMRHLTAGQYRDWIENAA